MKTFFIIMKKFFILLIAGIFVFLFTFDANQYKDLLVEKIEDIVDKDVKIGDVSLNFLPALSLRIDEISVKDSNKTWGDAILDAYSVNAGVKLMPLIKKDIEVQHLSIKELTIDIGGESSSSLKPIFRDIELKGAMISGDIVIKRLTGLVAGGYFSAKGTLEDVFLRQHLEVDLVLKDIKVSDLLPEVGHGMPQFEAMLNMDMQASIKGLDIQRSLDTLVATGTARIEEGVLRNVNLLNLALSKLNSILPGLVGELKAKLPPRYSELLKQNYTAFKPIETDFNIKDRKVFFQETEISSDAFYMIGSGYLSIERDLGVSCDLFIPRDLSKAFVDEVYELKYLQNNQGMITMPVDVSGRIPDVSVRPDLDYAMKRLAVATGERLLRSIFKKDEPRDAGTNEPDTGGSGETQGQKEETQRKPEPEEVLIRTIFDIISGPGK